MLELYRGAQGLLDSDRKNIYKTFYRVIVYDTPNSAEVAVKVQEFQGWADDGQEIWHEVKGEDEPWALKQFAYRESLKRRV